MRKKNSKNYILFLFLFLLSLGFSLIFSNVYSVDFKQEEYNNFLFSTKILLLYILPISGGIIYTSKLWNIQLRYFLVSLLGGSFIAVWISAYLNELGDLILQFLIPFNSIREAWSASLTAPFVEEGIKIFVVIMIMYLLSIQNIRQVLIVGSSVGLGFQIIEDLSYILNETIQSSNAGIPQALIRSSSSISSHWMFTGILAVGFFLYQNKEINVKMNRKKQWVILPVVLHFLWNSPANITFGELPIISSALSATVIFVYLQVFNFVKDNAWNSELSI